MQSNRSSTGSTAPARTAIPAVVLIVEDEVVVRQVTAQVLKSAGYLVLETGSPSEALRVAGEYGGEIDLLLTDVVMPEMNGIELAERVCHLRPNVATVFMSGYMEVDGLRRPKAESAVHIQKPFTVNSLLAQIAAAL